MADTIRGNFSNVTCSDCGSEDSVCFQHWGPLVPEGEVGYFCGFCWEARQDDVRLHHRPPRPLGEAVIEVRVHEYADAGLDDSTNSCRPEIVIHGTSFILDHRYKGNANGCMPQAQANEIATKVAKRLGVVPKLAV